MTTDPSRYAIGKGRQRPPYQPQVLNCSNCGGSLSIPDERAQTVSCHHCHHVLTLSDGQLKAIGTLSHKPEGFRFRLHQKFEWGDVSYKVIGRIAHRCAEDPDDSPVYSYLLYHRMHPSLWLSEYEGQWELTQRTRVMPTTNPLTLSDGNSFTTHDGREWKVVEVVTNKVIYVDGALPWQARVGDQIRVAECHAPSSNQTYEVEQNARNEIEFGSGQRITRAQVAEATGADPKSLGGNLITDLKPEMRALSLIVLTLAMACFVALGAIWLGSKKLTTQYVLDGRLGSDRVGPLEIKKPNTVLSIDIGQQFSGNGWKYIEAELQSANEDYLMGFGDELWAESGRDSDGPWHEEDNEYNIKLTVPQPGTYFLKFSAEGNVSRGRTTVAVKQLLGSMLPFQIGGIAFFLLGLWLYDLATGGVRRALVTLSEMADS